MDQSEKELIIKRYSERIKQYGDSPLTLGWTKGKHFLRYHILLNHWQFNGETLLDFGCGFGDLYAYIKKQGFNLNYKGYDINPDLITIGKTKYPEAELSTDDIFSFTAPKIFDYAVSSGVHNFKIRDNWEFIKHTFERFAFLCRKGFALNFVSNKVTIFNDELYHADPAKVLNLAYVYSKNVILRNDYMPFEFTIIVNLNDEFDMKSVVYPDYLSYII